MDNNASKTTNQTKNQLKLVSKWQTTVTTTAIATATLAMGGIVWQLDASADQKR